MDSLKVHEPGATMRWSSDAPSLLKYQTTRVQRARGGRERHTCPRGDPLRQAGSPGGSALTPEPHAAGRDRAPAEPDAGRAGGHVVTVRSRAEAAFLKNALLLAAASQALGAQRGVIKFNRRNPHFEDAGDWK